MTALYHEHAPGLTRLAHVMLGDQAAAEDAVQEAFAGLFRRWAFLDDPAKAPAYLRSSVLNQCLDPAKPTGDLLTASRVVPFTGKAPTGITYSCGATGAVMSLDGTTMTCGGSPSTDYGFKLQSIGVITISARTGVPLRYLPVRRYGAWVTGPSMIVLWASPSEAGTCIALPWDYHQLPKMPDRLTVWRHGKVAGTIPLGKDSASRLLSFRGQGYLAW